MKRPRKIAQDAPKPTAPRVVGYARVSTSDQRLDLQIDALTKAGVHPDNIHRDYASGARAARRGLRNAMRDLREGDTLLVWKLDRLGRDLPDLIRNMQELDKIGVAFRSPTRRRRRASSFSTSWQPSRSSSGTSPESGRRLG
jgi:DNA invertase Pin-like site-specific DNA recombinase